jgi:phosphoglycerate dehydrogenase-like enzyme
MPQALYYKPSYERLRESIHALVPDLDVALYDEHGCITHGGREVALEALAPEWFWIHSELFFSPRIRDYFKVMAQVPSLKWLHTVNTGLDGLPYLDVVERGAMVTNNHAQAIAIAEFVLGQVLAHYQHVVDNHEQQKLKAWKHRGFREIMGSRWVVIGFGEIGRNVASRAKAFGAHVTAVRRGASNEGIADAVVTQSQLSQVLPQADVVVMACASNAGTRNLADAHFFAAMKQGSVFVNIARGDLVVEAALQAALDKGVPAHAILDVFNAEPPVADSWVWAHPCVTLTPHTSNGGSGMRARADATFLGNLERMVKGQPLLNRVTRSDIV